MTVRVKLSGRNQISLPSIVRRRLNIRPGDHLLVEIRGGHIVMMPEPKDFADHLRGLHREVWEGIDPQAYVRQEREAWRE
jgi:AbrB family looped-hinge helix DNA binding protein